MRKAVALLLLVLATTPAWSQSNVTYTFSGEKDADNERVENDEKLGDGNKKIDTYTFTLKVDNLSNEEVKKAVKEFKEKNQKNEKK